MTSQQFRRQPNRAALAAGQFTEGRVERSVGWEVDKWSKEKAGEEALELWERS